MNDVELAAALGVPPPKVASRRCWFWHAWSKWRRTAQGTVVFVPTQAVIGAWVRTERTCALCGKFEMRDVTT